MTDPNSRYVLTGSSRGGPSEGRTGDPQAGAPIEVTVYLRGSQPEPGQLTREQYAQAHGAASEDVEAVRQFAAQHGLVVDDIDVARRRVELSGSLEAMTAAFQARLGLYRDSDGNTYRATEGDLSVPRSLEGVITGVFGLDERPQAQPHFRPRANAETQYTPPQVAAAYQFPIGVTGSGQCVAIIELGGGFREDDLSDYFKALDIALPAVQAVSVDKATNQPGKPNGPDTEVMLDIEVLGSVAPGASIAVYFAPNTDRGFIDAVTQAVHDAERKPSVVSISWGGPESTWTAQAMHQMEDAFIAAAAMGVTVTVAAGDNGSGDGATDGLAHVDFPASAPHALACGGTSLQITAGQASSEVVWDDGAQGGAGGGGISNVFPVPSYQASVSMPLSANPPGGKGRGVPDISGDADPDTGYMVRVDGETTTVGGTSAVAPLWAGLVALLNEALDKPVGFLQPFLYSAAARGGLHDVSSGGNGAYSAGPGWDPCTGLGSPRGAALLEALKGPKR